MSTAHYVFTRDDPALAGIVAVAMNIDKSRADEIAHEITRGLQASGELPLGQHVEYCEVPAYTPRPIQPGDIITRDQANTLPRGSVIVRARTADGVEIRNAGALLRAPCGWLHDTQHVTSTNSLDYASRYRVLHIAHPTEG